MTDHRARTDPHPFDSRTRFDLDRPESRKWSLHPGRIGAWVAEMDFGVAPVIADAMHLSLIHI